MKFTSLFSKLLSAIKTALLMVFLGGQLFATAALAEVIQRQVATASESAMERDAAQRIGLQLALTEISSYKGLLNSEVARLALSDAGSYVTEQTFRAVEQSDDLSGLPMTRSVTEAGRVASIATIRFDTERVLILVGELEAALLEAQESAGEEGRIVVDQSSLVWLVVRDQGRDLLITEETGENLVLRSKDIAGQVGETLQFPDATVSEALVTEVLTSAPEQVREASRTYNAGAIVIGLITRESARRWQGEWQRVTDEAHEKTTLEAASLDAMLDSGVGWATGVASTTTDSQTPPGPRTAGSSSSPAQVWVAGAGSTDSYSKVLSWMNQLESVERVYPVDVGSDGVLFAVTPNAALVDISTAIQSVNWLNVSPERSLSPDDADLYLAVEP